MDGQSRLRGIIWDVDGTLCDTLPLCIAAFRSCLAPRLRRTPTDAEIVAGFGATEAGTIRKFVPDDWQSAEREFLDCYERDHDASARVFDGVVAMLATLRDRGLRQAVVTGKGMRTATITLERLGLRPFVERVETGSDAGPIKPDGIRAILAAWQLPPASVAYVGDTPYDVRAANECGVLALRAAWSQTSGGMADESAKPAATFDSPNALLAWALERI